MSSVRIDVTVINRTDLALLVSDGRREAWVPFSQMDEEIVEPSGQFGLMTVTAIVIPDWVAKEKGLQQVHQDVDTLDMFGGAS